MGLTAMVRARGMPNRNCPKTETTRILLNGPVSILGKHGIKIHPTFWIRRGLNDVEQFHIRDVVDINLSLKHNNQCLPIHLDSKYRVWK